MSDPVTRMNAALVGRYTIERELGQGGMATVYLAEEEERRSKMLVTLAEELGLGVIDPLPVLLASGSGPIHRLPIDGHWPATTHRLVGELVADYLTDSAILLRDEQN